jgi:predicted nucleic acid-binding protein
MIVVCDMGPLHYLVLMDTDSILPQLFTRVLTPPAVLMEMRRPETPELVQRWAASPPQWLEVKQPSHIENIPALGQKGTRGEGDRAVIALAREERANFVVMDDMKARREVRRRGAEPLWMLQVLEEGAERGFIDDIFRKLEYLEHHTTFYIGAKARVVIEDMKQRDLERKQAQEQGRQTRESTIPAPPHNNISD